MCQFASWLSPRSLQNVRKIILRNAQNGTLVSGKHGLKPAIPWCSFDPYPYCRHVAVGQNQWYHLG